MITLSTFADSLLSNKDIYTLSENISIDMHNKNIFPIFFSRYKTPDSERLRAIVSSSLTSVDLDTMETISKEKYRWIRQALSYDQAAIEQGYCPNMLISHLIDRHTPKIDQYISSINDYTLVKSLDVPVDKEGMIKITENMTLKKHGLILDDNIMIYPHQFLRRFYSANFVDILTILDGLRDKGNLLEIRIDPFRKTDPMYYRDITEMDYWYGPKFNTELFNSKDAKKIRTVYTPPADTKDCRAAIPIKCTIFRSDMMDLNERQFSVEEYMSLSEDPLSKDYGKGSKYIIQKYAHFVYDQNTKLFSHIDGAVRIFTRDSYEEIVSSIGNKDPGKRIGSRHKLFKLTGSISLTDIQNILYSFFMYNPNIEEYFSNK